MDKRNVTRPISALDVTALLSGVLAASLNREVGIEDAGRTAAELLKELNVSLRLSDSVIESALWACNMLHERGLFKHSDGVTSFDVMAKRIAGRDVYDLDYCYFRDRRR